MEINLGQNLKCYKLLYIQACHLSHPFVDVRLLKRLSYKMMIRNTSISDNTYSRTLIIRNLRGQNNKYSNIFQKVTYIHSGFTCQIKTLKKSELQNKILTKRANFLCKIHKNLFGELKSFPFLIYEWAVFPCSRAISQLFLDVLYQYSSVSTINVHIIVIPLLSLFRV